MFNSFEDITAALPPSVLTEPARTITPLGPRDPSRLGYPPTFPVEIALRTHSTRRICEEYGIDEAEWNRIRFEPLFLQELERAVEMLKVEGMTFKIKAKLQAEGLLQTSWKLIHDTATPPNVRADLIKACMRWAGFETPPTGEGSVVGNGFSINIQFSGKSAEPRLVSEQ